VATHVCVHPLTYITNALKYILTMPDLHVCRYVHTHTHTLTHAYIHTYQLRPRVCVSGGVHTPTEVLRCDARGVCTVVGSSLLRAEEGAVIGSGERGEGGEGGEGEEEKERKEEEQKGGGGGEMELGDVVCAYARSDRPVSRLDYCVIVYIHIYVCVCVCACGVCVCAC